MEQILIQSKKIKSFSKHLNKCRPANITCCFLSSNNSSSSSLTISSPLAPFPLKKKKNNKQILYREKGLKSRSYSVPYVSSS